MHENRETSAVPEAVTGRSGKGLWPNAGYARCGGVGLRCSTCEPAEQERETAGGGGGGKTGDQGEHRTI